MADEPYMKLANIYDSWLAQVKIYIDKQDDAITTAYIAADAVITAAVAATYLKLDTSNGPLTGNLGITKADPEYRLTDSGNSQYARLVKSDTTNEFYGANRALTVSGTGSAVSFNANTDYVTIPANAGYNLSTGDFSISLWAKIDAIGTVRRFLTYMKTVTFKGITFYLLNTNKLTLYIDDDVAAGINISQTATFTDTTAAHHFMVTADRDGLATLYVDNVSVGSGSIAALSGSLDTAAQDWRIGDWNASSQSLVGWIQEVAVFNKVLDATERTREYAAGAGYYHDGTETGLIQLLHLNEGSGGTTTESMQSASCVITSGGWTTGIVAIPNTYTESKVWQSLDGIETGESAVNRWNKDNNARGVINGKDVRIEVGGVEQVKLTDGYLNPITTNDIDLGTSALRYKNMYLINEYIEQSNAVCYEGDVVTIDDDIVYYL